MGNRVIEDALGRRTVEQADHLDGDIHGVQIFLGAGSADQQVTCKIGVASLGYDPSVQEARAFPLRCTHKEL